MGELHRHLYFGQGHDWHDIAELDWPFVRADIEAADLSDADPLPVPPSTSAPLHLLVPQAA
jgi:hypothetical protein